MRFVLSSQVEDSMPRLTLVRRVTKPWILGNLSEYCEQATTSSVHPRCWSWKLRVVGDTEVVVVDVGRRSGLLEFLDQQCIRKIRTLSHADEDHIGALVGLLASDKVTIDRVVLNSDALKDTEIWNDLAYELNSAHMAGTEA